MRLAIVCNTSWYIYNFRSNLIRALIDQGCEVHTVAPVDDFTPKLREMGCRHHSLSVDNNRTNLFKDLNTFFQLLAIYRGLKADVLLHFTAKPNIYGTLAARFLRQKCLNNIAGLGTAFLSKGLLRTITLFLYRLSQNYGKALVFFQNKDDQKLFLQEKIVKKEQADLLPGSGVDLARFSYTEKKAAPCFVFLLVARLLIDKGVVEYMRAAKSLKEQGFEAEFKIVGDLDPGNARSVPRSTIEQYEAGQIVRRHDFSTRVIDHLIEADCLVLPSYYPEGVPRVLLEGAAVGRPLIAADSVGCREAVDDGVSGFLCRPKDIEDLALKMRQMYELPAAERQKMGLAGRRKMEAEFDEKIVIAKYLAAIERLIKR